MTKVTVTATDHAGNTSSAMFTITVVDTTPPVLSNVPANQNVQATGPSGAVVTYPSPPATDLVDPNPTVTATPPSGSSFPLGATTVTVTATDHSGNSSSATFTVNVVDTTPPALANVPANQTVQATGPSGAVVTYPSPTATDLVDPNPTVTSTPPSGSTFPLGPTTVRVTATDHAGNSSGATFTVNVVDTTPPALANVPGNQTVRATGPSGAVVYYASATATDPVDPNPTVTSTPPSGSTFPEGTTTVTVTATDHAGNSSSATFTVTVVSPLVTIKAVSIQKITTGKTKTDAIAVQFSGQVNGATADNLAVYTLTTETTGKKHITKPLPLSRAIYSAATETVMLILKKSPIPLSPPPTLTIDGASLLDSLSRQIDGRGNGQPGGNYVAKLTKAGAIAVSSVRSSHSSLPTAHAVDALLKAGYHPTSDRSR
jgi:hypothetical protein